MKKKKKINKRRANLIAMIRKLLRMKCLPKITIDISIKNQTHKRDDKITLKIVTLIRCIRIAER